MPAGRPIFMALKTWTNVCNLEFNKLETNWFTQKNLIRSTLSDLHQYFILSPSLFFRIARMRQLGQQQKFK